MSVQRFAASASVLRVDDERSGGIRLQEAEVHVIREVVGRVQRARMVGLTWPYVGKVGFTHDNRVAGPKDYVHRWQVTAQVEATER